MEGAIQKHPLDFRVFPFALSHHLADLLLVFKAYKHIFTSPSSVDKTPKATRSGNARIHGMTRVTPASIAYIATQVWGSPVVVAYLFTHCFLGTVCPQLLVCVLQD
jgi:hypothetical protein